MTSLVILALLCHRPRRVIYHESQARTLTISRLYDGFSGDDDVFQESTAREFCAKLNAWKASGEIQLWNSSLTNNIVSSTTRINVQLISRSSFSTNDYFSDVVESMRKSQELSFQPLFIVLCAASFLFGSLIVPFLSVPVDIKNALGLVGLFLPFAVLFTQSIAPDLFASLLRKYSNKVVKYQKKRIIVHEAGHVLAGYISGVVIKSYDVTGDRDAGTTIQLEEDMNSSVGRLLIVAFAGVVAETLVFGDCRGGGDDIRMAMVILQSSRIPSKDYEGSLRWAVMKSLVLLRLHRDSLDALIDGMEKGENIAECIRRIEDAHIQSR